MDTDIDIDKCMKRQMIGTCKKYNTNLSNIKLLAPFLDSLRKSDLSVKIVTLYILNNSLNTVFTVNVVIYLSLYLNPFHLYSKSTLTLYKWELTLSMGPFWNTCGSSQTTQYSFNTGIRCSANSIVWIKRRRETIRSKMKMIWKPTKS